MRVVTAGPGGLHSSGIAVETVVVVSSPLGQWSGIAGIAVEAVVVVSSLLGQGACMAVG